MAKVSSVEVNFKRLLQRAEKMIADEPKAKDSKEFAKYLQVMQQQYTEICSQKTDAASKDTLTKYSERLSALFAQKDPRNKIMTFNEMNNELMRQDKQTSNQIPENSSTTPKKEAVFLLGNGSSKDTHPSNTSTQMTWRKGFRAREEDLDEDTFQKLLEKNAEEQQKYTEDMATFARSLKDNSTIMSTVLEKDNKELELLEQAVDENVKRVGQETSRVKLHATSSCSWTLTYLLIIMFVAVVFMMTYFFMKLNPK